jgi:hypothetical protein
MSAEMIATCLGRYRQHCIAQDEEEARKRVAGEPPERFQVLTIAELCRERSPEERIADILKDPVRSALKGYVRERGWKLWFKGGTAAMQKVSDKVEDLCPNFPTFAGATLDKWWDGIGNLDDPKGMWVA